MSKEYATSTDSAFQSETLNPGLRLLKLLLRPDPRYHKNIKWEVRVLNSHMCSQERCFPMHSVHQATRSSGFRIRFSMLHGEPCPLLHTVLDLLSHQQNREICRIPMAATGESLSKPLASAKEEHPLDKSNCVCTVETAMG